MTQTLPETLEIVITPLRNQRETDQAWFMTEYHAGDHGDLGAALESDNLTIMAGTNKGTLQVAK
jgi:hypothetical protein